jgi:hypothetical protein
MRDLGGPDAAFSELAEIASQSGTSEEIHISLDSHLRA